MMHHPAFRRAFAITMIAFSPVIYLSATSDAKPAPAKNPTPPCVGLATWGPNLSGKIISYTGSGVCPQATVVRWTLTINRSGLPWVSRSGLMNTRPYVSKRCVRNGPPITLRPILKLEATYASGAKSTRTVRGQVISIRCAP